MFDKFAIVSGQASSEFSDPSYTSKTFGIRAATGR